MKTLTLKEFKAYYKLDIIKDLCFEITLDADIDKLIKEGDGIGEKYVMCRVHLYDLRNDENYERDYFFPLEITIDSIMDLFINEFAMIAKSFRKGSIIDWITKSNPQTAWLFYKKTFDNVMNGLEIKNNTCFTADLKCKCQDGTEVLLKHFDDHAERIFLIDEQGNEKYLGRVETRKIKDTTDGNKSMKENEQECKIEEEYPFLCDTKINNKYSGARYSSFFNSKDIFVETGLCINHPGTLKGIISGLGMAVEKFLNQGV